jgi:hypothetical protein
LEENLKNANGRQPIFFLKNWNDDLKKMGEKPKNKTKKEDEL